ncbi:MAG TPA: polyphosphate kinase 1 [Gemmatimonadales bacterium]|nr:polyphosphate kinase 1 [Gemmatimonadales bacterium]
MGAVTERRWDIPSTALRDELVAAPLPLGLASGPPVHTFYRDLYFETAERELARRGARCRLRFDMDDRRWLALDAPGAGRWEAAVQELDPRDVFRGGAEPARRLRALVDPERLVLQFELQVERWLRRGRLPVIPISQFQLACDTITTRRGGAGLAFHELVVWRDRWGVVPLPRLERAIAARYGVGPARLDRVDRAAQLLDARAERVAESTGTSRRVAVVAVAHGRMALCHAEAALQLPLEDGAGQDACRRAMRRWFGNAEGEIRLLGVTPGGDGQPVVEVWLVRRLRRDLSAAPPAGLQWFAPADIVARVGSPVLRDAATLAALAVAARSELVPEWSAAPLEADAPPAPVSGGSTDERARLTLSELRVPVLPAKIRDAATRAPDQFINVELSSLEFNARVLALAEDPETPLAARLRFLSIFSTNLDHFFMVEVGALKEQVAAGVVEPSPDGMSAPEQLDAIAIRLRPLIARKYRVLEELAAGPLPAAGIRLVDWADLSTAERAPLAQRFRSEIMPFLTPKALTRAPGHRFPQLGDRRVALAVMLRDQADGPVHFAAVELPASLPRLLAVPGAMVPTESVVRGQVGELFPSREVVAAHAFRVTRSGDIHLDELGTASFVQAVAEEVRRRPWGPVVRIEVERGMPQELRDLLQRELRFEESELHSALGPSDVYEAGDPVDLSALDEVATHVSRAGLDYRRYAARDPFAGEGSIFSALDRGDVLVHHPFDSFAASFERFITEAADDPATVAIKLTLYRPGGPSAIGDALRRAAAHGKEVSVFVELKARFDEELNIGWAQSLEAAGIHVITGLATLKTHAKIALVVRREGNRTRRYAHVGSGNYNPDTAKVYTDLGLFTADDSVAEDVHALFNELTGSSRPPQAAFRRLLVAPTNMLDRFLALIARESEHARAGRGGRIQAKLNGLADATVIGALYRAAQAGTQIDLVVRGLCMLRPGVPGLSEGIRVVSVLGRFLEHARIYRFENAGAPEYFTGSADWRPRNLRRRVEVITPVTDPAARARLDRILALELTDPGAWQLQSDGSYIRPDSVVRAPGSQERLIADISQ